MSFEKPLTVKETIGNIHTKKYLLPAIQREFVWKTNQIERLFDSLMREYPVGSFLFWHVDKEKIKDYEFYEFIREYHERVSKHNPKADIGGENDITAILDGQQRLTALYLGLKGSYANKLPRKRWNDDEAFPKRYLYLNLLKKSDDSDMEYDFHFLTKEESEVDKIETDKFWFRVGDILDLKEPHEVNNFLIDKNLSSLEKEKSKFANRTLFKLHKIIHNDVTINYYLEKENSLDKVLNIFIRVNSGGTKLSYSDLLLSMATAQWHEKDAREEINKFVDELNHFGNGFDFDKDFVLKTCLVLNDFPDIAFKVENFKKNMPTIEKNWDKISEAIKLAVALVSNYGYDRETLTSNNAIIPIAYYLLKKDSPANFVLLSEYKEDRKKIQKWLILSLLKRAFSGQPDNVLRPIRETILYQHTLFPLDEIINKLKGGSGTKSIAFNDDDVENLFSYEYGQSYTFSTLALLYPSLDFRNKFHQDHIFPKSVFTKKKLLKIGIPEEKHEIYLDEFNCIANLQLLEGIPNKEKSDSDFEKWLNKTFSDETDKNEYMNKHFIPNINLGVDNFDNFIIERKKLMSKKLKLIIKGE